MSPPKEFAGRVQARLAERIGPHLAAPVAAVLSVLAGLAVALLFEFLLYRIGLPGKPFIYVAF
jgi:hypothetical protein